MDIYELEKSGGIVVSVGGQLPQNIALKLQEQGNATILGTDPVDIDQAEDRYKFSQILDSIGVDQPAWKELSSIDEAKSFCNQVSYPVLVRPSYVLSGAAMSVIRNESELEFKLGNAASVSPNHPVVITKFIEGAKEIDVDAVAHKGQLLVHAVSEHVENAGIHSGDATLILPPVNLTSNDMSELKTIAQKVAKAWKITGPFNMQIIKTVDNQYKVIECNIRASRSFPFVSKVLGTNFIDFATRALLNIEQTPVDLMNVKRDYVATKVPQFSFTRLAGADPFLGVEMASTGEVACFGKDLIEAYWTSIQSTMNFKLPMPNCGLLFGGDLENDNLGQVVKLVAPLGYQLYVANESVKSYLSKFVNNGIQVLDLPRNDKRKLSELFESKQIKGVFNLARQLADDLNDEDYIMRRNAIDFGIPLFNESQTALLFAQTLKEKLPLKLQNTTTIPSEVKRWSEWIGHKNV